MLKRYFINPDDMWSRVENGELLYTPITVLSDTGHSHIYLSGQTARLPSGELAARDMRGQIRQVCENIGRGLEHVGATFDDVVTSTTFVLDLQDYYRASDERFKYFKNNRPASTLIQISSASVPGTLIAVNCQAIIETERLKVS